MESMRAGQAVRMLLSAALRRARGAVWHTAEHSAPSTDIDRAVARLAEALGREPVPRYALIGGAACRLYQRPRPVADVDILVTSAGLEPVRRRLREAGYAESIDTRSGQAEWRHGDDLPVDLSVCDEPWVDEALSEAASHRDSQGACIIPLPYLVVLKIRRASGKHRWDVARMLARSEILDAGTSVAATRALIAAHRPGSRRTLEVLLWAGRVELGTMTRVGR